MGARVLVEWIAGGLVAGQLLATAGWAPPDARLAAGGVLAAALGWAVIVRPRLPAMTAIATLAAALAGAVHVTWATAVPDDPDHVGRLVLPLRTRVVGRVAERPLADAKRTIVVLDVATIGTRPRTWGRIRVRIRGDAAFVAGDVIAFEATLRRPRNFENPGRFDLEGHLARRGVHVATSVWDPASIERLGRAPGSATAQALEGWRAAVRAVIARDRDPDVAAVLTALVLGEERGIAPPLREAFTRAGVVHVVSVSGLHVGIVTAAAAGLLAWALGRSSLVLLMVDVRKIAVGGGLVTALTYGALTGFAVATMRAVVMAGVVVAAVLLDRRAEPLRALALAALLVSAMQPGAPADISFQLSFMSVAALLLGARDAGAPGDGSRAWLRRAGRAALAAWIGTVPLTALHFHQVSLVSVVANPIVVPLFEAASLLPALAGALVAPVAPSLADAAFTVAAVPVRIALAIVSHVGTWSWAAVDVPLPSVLEVVLLYGLLGGAWYRRVPAARLLAVLCLVALSVDAAWWAGERLGRRPRVTFLDVGQGDAAVAELADGRVMVVDAGGFGGSDFDTGAALVEPFLRARKIRRVDVVVMSHAHPDHAGGLAHLIRRFAPVEVWWSGLGGEGGAWGELVAALRETGTPIRTLRAGDAIADYPEVEVLHPPAAWTIASLNDGSLVLRIGVGAMRVLFTGDAERDAETAMLAHADRLTAGVLKVPHHGSRTSSAWPFVVAVAPAVAVMSMGADNRFAHPAPDVVARYGRAGATVYRTDRCGAVTMRADARGLRVETARPACVTDPPTVRRLPPP